MSCFVVIRRSAEDRSTTSKITLSRIVAKCQGIARELDLDPLSVYRTLRRANTNLVKVEEMIQELKALGWPDKLSQKAGEAEPEYPVRLG